MSDKLVLVYYCNIGNLDYHDIEGYLKKVAENLGPKDDDMLRYIIPIRDGDSRVECINPKLVNATVFSEAIKKLVKAESTMLNIIKKMSNNK